MAEVVFPGTHTTTTVTSSTSVRTDVRFDPSYLRSMPGVLKAAQILLSLLGFICIQCSRFNYHSKGAFFSWISMVAFWFSGILLGLYLFHFVERFYRIPWLRIELVFCSLWTFFYLLAASLAVTYDDAYSAAAFFGYCAMGAYLVDALVKWRGVRAGGLAQGARVVARETTTTTLSGPGPHPDTDKY